jgi:putative sensor protein
VRPTRARRVPGSPPRPSRAMLSSMETTHAPAAMRRLAYHLLGLPLGTAYFTWLVTGVSTGIGLAITLVGIPLLTLVLAGVRPLPAGERALANALIDADVPAAPLAPAVEGGC